MKKRSEEKNFQDPITKFPGPNTPLHLNTKLPPIPTRPHNFVAIIQYRNKNKNNLKNFIKHEISECLNVQSEKDLRIALLIV